MTDGAGTPLRVGLLLDRPAAPRWVHLAVRAIQALPQARIVLLLQAESDPSDHRESRGWRHVAYRLFRRLDRRVYRGRPDSLEESALAPHLPDCPSLTLRPGQGNLEVGPAAETIRAHRLDVLIDFRQQGAPIAAAGIARLGVWSFRHGATPGLAARPPAFREVVEGKEPFFSALVSDDRGDGSSRLLYASWSPTHKRSVHRTLHQCLPKLAQFPARVLRRLDSGDRIEGGPACQEVVFDGPYRPSAPGNGEVVTAVAKLARRLGRDLLGGRQSREGWHLACAFGSEGLSPRPDRILLPPAGTFQADPFPVASEDGYWIFFEEIPPASRVGHLCVMKMDRSGRCGPSRIILQQPGHLSYPSVYRIGTDWFLLPESAETKTVQLYRATRFPYEWVPVERLLEGVRAYDPTLVEIAGRWWMFVNQAMEGGSSWDELHLYHADRPQGPWRPHPRNPVVSDARRARPAGHLFEHRGAWYRPGQDCGIRYGRAVVINRIVRIDAREYEEVEAARILPDWDPRVLAVHTLNRAGDLTMLDCIYLARRRESGGAAQEPEAGSGAG